MKYCFIDESGNPSLNSPKPFVVAMVIFASLEEAEKYNDKIKDFRRINNIARDYEFHYSRNAAKNRDKFIIFIRDGIDSDNVKTVILEKKANRNILHEAAVELSDYLAIGEKYNIRLDENPKLFSELRSAIRAKGITAKIVQVKSKNNDLIQVADYFAGMAANEIEH